MKTLRNLFLDELADVYDAEHRIKEALLHLIQAATSEQLRDVLRSHLEETVGQMPRLQKVFEYFEEDVQSQKCKAIVGLLNEGNRLITKSKGSISINAAIICVAQKVEHYEIATYGCLRDWAKLLEHHEAANLLDEILDEEKAADQKLNELAQAINIEALGDGRAYGPGQRNEGQAGALAHPHDPPGSRKAGVLVGERQ